MKKICEAYAYLKTFLFNCLFIWNWVWRFACLNAIDLNVSFIFFHNCEGCIPVWCMGCLFLWNIYKCGIWDVYCGIKPSLVYGMFTSVVLLNIYKSGVWDIYFYGTVEQTWKKLTPWTPWSLIFFVRFSAKFVNFSAKFESLNVQIKNNYRNIIFIVYKQCKLNRY